MKIAGIIAEYNPFHKGHEHQISETRKKYKVDYIVVVTSGHFVQRGEPALLDKWTRTRLALLGGADLVLELPTLYATSSSKNFAYGAVSLFDALG
ncbi:MAG: nucleotidyltransferase family protein, partial [Vallitaleaceae bacterium]|nr:nucleotidyltransferase family protein [Vallitaleaceae bacterium]